MELDELQSIYLRVKALQTCSKDREDTYLGTVITLATDQQAEYSHREDIPSECGYMD